MFGNDHAEFVLGHGTPDQSLQLLDVVLRLLQPGSRRALHADDELAGVGGGEEGEPEKRHDQQAGGEDAREEPEGRERDAPRRGSRSGR